MVEKRLSHSGCLFKIAEGDLLLSLAQLDQIARKGHRHSCSCSPALHRLEDPAWPTWRRSKRLGLQASIHLAQGQYAQALALYSEQRAMLLGVGERVNLIKSEAKLCHCSFMLGRFDECVALAQSVTAREGSAPFGRMSKLFLLLIMAQVFSGLIGDARQTLVLAMPGWRRNGDVIGASGAMAVLLAEFGHWGDAARVGTAFIALQRRGQVAWKPHFQSTNARWQALLAAAACNPDDLARWQREGEALDEAAIEAICLRAVQAAPVLRALPARGRQRRRRPTPGDAQRAGVHEPRDHLRARPARPARPRRADPRLQPAGRAGGHRPAA